MQAQTLASPPSVAKIPQRVLVVDDNRDGANSLVMLLRCLGYDAQASYDGAAALAAAEAFEPSIVLLDLRLPVLDGFEVARRLRSGGQADCMLVAVSGLDSDEHAERVHAAGFDCHLVKPVDPTRLEAVLASAVQC